ncbi:universal stress protein [Aliamphritea hakodatensis]|uniref:universal stress protein n=1 Tax=Aliamphritea hakodatensis TaxID=2895352 RepID=UPI0022FD4EC2|nr:universal stress protein [Aliamphritea hakodatensis]
MYKKICVAVDGSEMSLQAVTAAAEIATAFSADLLLLHVIRPMKIPTELERYIKSDDLAKLRSSALEEVGKEIMTKALDVASQQGAEHVTAKVAKGDPAGTIIKQATKFEADLIVVGTRGLGKVEGALIGSISRKIADISSTSMLIVK